MSHDSSLYVYRVTDLVKVVDGDTYDFKVSAGFYLTYAHRFRLYDWDTPERYRGSPHERTKAAEATEVASDWLHRNEGALLIRTHKADSFGRWLADVFILLRNKEETREEHLSDYLAVRNLAVQYPQRWRDVHDPKGRQS